MSGYFGTCAGIFADYTGPFHGCVFHGIDFPIGSPQDGFLWRSTEYSVNILREPPASDLQVSCGFGYLR